MTQQPTKMRIKLYSEKGALLSDRLCEQNIEVKVIGPKEVHKGPLSLEINLFTQEDTDNIINYIQRLKGILPLKSKQVKITKGQVILDDKEPLEDLMNSAIKANPYQEDLINFLREHNFRFITSDVITEVVPELSELLKLKPKHLKYQYLIRIVKEAKDPVKDKYDHRLIFGVKLIGKKIDTIVVYLFGKFKFKKTIPWKKINTNNFKKVEQMTVFPPHLDYADRKKWRAEHRKVQTNPNHKASKFYTKNKPFIKLVEKGK